MDSERAEQEDGRQEEFDASRAEDQDQVTDPLSEQEVENYTRHGAEPRFVTDDGE